MSSEIERICIEKGMRMTDQRRVIAKVLSEAQDHPDVEEVYRRSVELDSRISIATVYRTVRLLEESGILDRHDFRVESGENRARFELVTEVHHDHLIDVESGDVIEFHNDEIEALQKLVAKQYGYDLVDHRMELYGKKIK